MTYNIRHGDKKGKDDVHLDPIAAVINKQKQDLVALQEVDINIKRAPLNEVALLAQAIGIHGYFIKSFDYQRRDILKSNLIQPSHFGFKPLLSLGF